MAEKIEPGTPDGTEENVERIARLFPEAVTEVGTETIEEMARLEPDYAVMRDASMLDNATQANFEELFKTYSPGTIRRVF